MENYARKSVQILPFFILVEFLRSSKEWNRVFYLDITELYQNLFITLYDEDENDADDFMGKLCVPILEMKGQFKDFYWKVQKSLLEDI